MAHGGQDENSIPSLTWNKPIPEQRDRWQSKILVWAVMPVLAVASLPVMFLASTHASKAAAYCRITLVVSCLFALAVWALRAATPGAAIAGGLICQTMMVGSQLTRQPYLLHSGLMSLILLFVLTFGATRAGRARKAQAGLAEPKRGRRTSQVIANLSTAALILLAMNFAFGSTAHALATIAMLAALGEATADTVSSELGQAFGGRPFLLPGFRRVQPGVDGAVSLLGTFAGMMAAALVTGAGIWSLELTLRQVSAAWTAAVLGLFFDSLLGATVERRGWLGNDLVNFSSTVFSAVLVLAVRPGL